MGTLQGQCWQFVDCDASDSGCRRGLEDKRSVSTRRGRSVQRAATTVFSGSTCKALDCTVRLPHDGITCTVRFPHDGITGYADVHIDSVGALGESSAQEVTSLTVKANQFSFPLYVTGCRTNFEHDVFADGCRTDSGMDHCKVANVGDSAGASRIVRSAERAAVSPRRGFQTHLHIHFFCPTVSLEHGNDTEGRILMVPPLRLKHTDTLDFSHLGCCESVLVATWDSSPSLRQK